MAMNQSHRIPHEQSNVEVKSELESGNSPAIAQNAISSNLIPTDQFENSNKKFSKGKDIRETPKYHDMESHINQRHHYIGTGVFNAENIDDLPPRYRTKVLSAYEWLAATFPQSNMTASDLIALNPTCPSKKLPTNNSFESQPSRDSSQGSQNSRGRSTNRRGNHNQHSFHNDRNTSSNHESSSHSLHNNHLNHCNSSQSSLSDLRTESRGSSTSSRYTENEKIEPTYNNKSSQNNSQLSKVSPHRIPGDSQKYKPVTKSFPNQRTVNEKDSDFSDLSLKGTNVSDFPSVHSNKSFSPVPVFAQNNPNVFSKQYSRTESRPSNQNCEPHNRKQNDNKQNSSYKSIANERTNKFSNLSSSPDAKGCANATQSKSDSKRISNHEDSNFVSDNTYGSNQKSISPPNSSVASDKSFPNKKQNTNSSVGCFQFSSASQSRNTSESKSNTEAIKLQAGLNYSSLDEKQNINLHNKNSSDFMEFDNSRSSLKDCGKRQNNSFNKQSQPSSQGSQNSRGRFKNRRGNHNQRNFHNDADRNTAVEQTNVLGSEVSSSLSENSFNSKPFSNYDQGKKSYVNSTKSNEKASTPQIRESKKEDVSESILEVISERNKKASDRFGNQGKMTISLGSVRNDRGNSKFYQNETVNGTFIGTRKGEGTSKFNQASHTNQASISRFTDKNKSLKSLNSNSGKDKICDSNTYNRPDSRNSVSYEHSDERITNASRKNTNRNNPGCTINYEFSDPTMDDTADNVVYEESNLQNSVSSKSFSDERKSDTYRKQAKTPHFRQNVNSDLRRDYKNSGYLNSRTSVSSESFSDERSSDSSHKQKGISDPHENVNSTSISSNFTRGYKSRPDSDNFSSSKFSRSKNFDNRTQIKNVDHSDEHTYDVSESPSNYLRRRVAEIKQENYEEEKREKEITPKKNPNKCEEKGFFVSVNVSDSSNKEMDWQKYFSNALKHNKFVLDSCCKFTDSKILSFEDKSLALDASSTLKKLKQKRIVPGQPHLILVGNVKWHRIRPCDCQDKMVQSCLIYFKEFSEKYIQEHQIKILDIEEELHALNKRKKEPFLAQQRKVLEDSLLMLRSMERVFNNYINTLKLNLKNVPPNYFHICKLKSNFMRECQSFQRSLPIYSRKDHILDLIRYKPVTIVSAETGSGKSTQLAEYLLQSWVAERGTIICTQPRKIAAISITNYVCAKIGSAVGKLVGYDVGTDKKYDKDTKIIYMTDYALLRKFLRNRRLKGISCVIIDEAHERTLHTDLLLGMLKQCMKMELEMDRQDLRVVITSATIDPSVFVQYFSFQPADKSPAAAVINVPGRVYPVEVVWMDEDIYIGWNYLKACVEKAVKIHTDQPNGDILVFLTSPSEIDEAILMFKDLYSNPQMPMLLSLHGKSDLNEQKRIFDVTSDTIRRIIFATNAAETSLTIPEVKYVIDCGMAKEMSFFPAKNKNCLMMNFINKSSAEQRKGRAGRTQPGVCYRMYSKKNFREMAERASPEILRTSLQSALLKLYELNLDPHNFEFVESPSKESIAKSLESLELLDLVKNERLTDLGKKVVELEIEPRLAKLVLQGIKLDVGYEMIIIAAMVKEAGRIFIRFEDNKVLADQKKLKFCQETGDLCTYLEVYKRYREVAKDERYEWCVQNCLSSKAIYSAEKAMQDIITCLRLELSIHVIRRYNNQAFRTNFESIIFNCFSENLCMYSGHPKVGYFSFLVNDSLFIHPSSSLYYLGRDLPQFLVYNTLMQTTQNFLMDVTPITEDVLNKSYHKGYFKMSADVLKTLKILPKVLGPFGDVVLRNHIIGKGGSKILNLEVMVEKLTNSRNFKIDVVRENGTIVIYSEGRFHQKISQHISDIVKEAQITLAKDEDIVKMAEGFFYVCIGSGGIVNDIIMPGEFREIIIENVYINQLKDVEICLQNLGNIKSIRKKETNRKSFEISATYLTVTEALKAKQDLSQKNLNVKSNIFVQEHNGMEKPIYRIQLSWSRALSDGTGWVEFDSEADCIGANSCLSSKSFSIGHKYIRFTPSSLSEKLLEMINLPLIVDEQEIEKNLLSVLPSLIKVKNIHIKRKKLPAATNDNSLQMQNKLNAQFCRFAAPSKMIINVNCPTNGDPMWRALVYFDNPEDGEKAFKDLNGKLCIDSVPVQLNAIRKSHLFCKSQVLRAVKKEIDQLNVKFSDTTFTFSPTQSGTMVDIGFSCKSMKNLFAVQQNLLRILQGLTIQGSGNKNLSYLFTVRGQQLLSKIEQLTKTVIILDTMRKVISIYGSKENCKRAQEEIHILVKKEVSAKKKVFDLKNSCMPNGFLKCLYIKYGFDLQGLIEEFGLKAAVLNAFKGTLTIEASSKNLMKVEEHLEKICTDLYNKHQTVKFEEGKEVCDICLDQLSIDFYRLENCGHAFCKECLLFQVESKTIPLACTKKDCGKHFFMIDIKTLLSRGDKALRKSFYDTVLQHHVQRNIGKISYCPIPDCNMVYRVSKVEAKHHCAGCQNIICSYCQTPDHYMSCDMYRRCKEDEDYSLKVWMNENPNLRKQCPTCRAVIEKESGCNHMECLNCNSHICWLCLEVFRTGDDVYAHLPYCPKNQGQET